VWASVAANADVVVAAREATVAFAGARVRDEDTDGWWFQAEGKFESGAIDGLVRHQNSCDVVSAYLRAFSAAEATPPEDPLPPPAALPGADRRAGGWQAVLAARDPRRHRADFYLERYFDETVTLSGDRCGGRDAHLRTGLGIRTGRAAAFIAQTGAPTAPAGFRTAIRVLQVAERLRIPALTLIDTPGALNTAEADGVGTSIAQLLEAMVSTTIPVTSVVIGEGGSGGALAFAAPENLWAVPSSHLSVIAPKAQRRSCTATPAAQPNSQTPSESAGTISWPWV
jgi:acetyl-CoA carboxylase carboxyl transferase subunit beta